MFVRALHPGDSLSYYNRNAIHSGKEQGVVLWNLSGTKKSARNTGDLHEFMEQVLVDSGTLSVSMC